jgi:hypothetical protein
MRRLLLGLGLAVVLVVGFLAFRHAGHKAAEGSFDAAIAQLPPGFTATHGSSAYDAVTGTLSVHDVVLAHDGRPLWSAAHLRIEGADQRALGDVLDPRRYPGGKPAWADRRRLLGHAEADDVTLLIAGEQPAHIKQVSLDGLEGRPFAMPPTRENQASQAFQADAARAFAFKLASLQGAAYAWQGKQPGQLTLGSASLTGYDGGQAEAGDMRDFAIRQEGGGKAARPVDATLASLSFKALDTTRALSLMQQDSHDKQAELGSIGVAASDLEGLRISAAGGPLVSVASIRASGTNGAGAPYSGTMKLHAMTVALRDMARQPGMAPVVTVLGGDTLNMDVDLAGSWDKQAQRLTIDRYDFDVRDLGTLRLSGVFSGLPSAADLSPSMSPMAKALALAQGRIERARVSWEDRGLANRLLGLAAQRTGGTPETVRAQLALPLASLSVMMPDQPDAAAQIEAFLADPQTLTVSAQPAQPVSLLDLGLANWTTRAHLLGLRVVGK